MDAVSAPGRTWTTRDVAVEEQFVAWQQIVDETYLPVRIDHGPDQVAGFRSSLTAHRIGDLVVSRLRSDPQSVHRTADLVVSAPGDVHFLNLPTRGSGLAVQDGRSAATIPGDFVLVDGSRPFSLAFVEPFDQIALMIPTPLIEPLLASPTDSTCRTVSGSSASGRVAAAAVRALAAALVHDAAPADARTVGSLTDHVVGLVALALTGVTPSTCGDPRTAHLQAALDEIDRSYADADLHPAVVAARICISVSYLTKLFAARGTTFGRALSQRRLDRAYALLGAHDEGTVTQIAYACGFTDPAHFSRSFRSRFGITPSARRSGAVLQTAAARASAPDNAEPGRSPRDPAPPPALNA